jgi:hypothetical protein
MKFKHYLGREPFSRVETDPDENSWKPVQTKTRENRSSLLSVSRSFERETAEENGFLLITLSIDHAFTLLHFELCLIIFLATQEC